jgi:gluconokinase
MIKQGQTPHLFVIWGPAGCGKSTVGQALAMQFQSPFVEGDEV